MRHACVVGGGPSGLAAAIALRNVGWSVTVFDSATPPIDKACGEGLLPDSLQALRKLGVEISRSSKDITSGFPFRGIRFTDEHSSVAADFPSAPALGLRRTVLHELLVRRASELGVDLRWGCKSNGSDGLCDLVIGADGGHSNMRQSIGFGDGRCTSKRYGFRQHFKVAPWSDYMEMHWGRRCQLYITPIAADQVSIAVVSRDQSLRLTKALDEFPEVKARLRNRSPITSERGSLSIMRRLSHVCRGNVALVGDASGSIDVITGEGLGLGFQQALALAQAAEAGSLEHYERAHRKLTRRPRLMANLLLSLEASPAMRRLALGTMAACPPIFASLLATHVGESSLLFQPV